MHAHILQSRKKPTKGPQTHGVLVCLRRAMMMTACDLSAIAKPWEIQSKVHRGGGGMNTICVCVRVRVRVCVCLLSHLSCFVHFIRGLESSPQ